MGPARLPEYDERLNRYLRLNTFPVSVKFLRSWEQLPERAKRPLKDMGNRLTTCQVIALSRRYGRVLPFSLMDEILESLEATHNASATRYPVTNWLNYTGAFPPSYDGYRRMLDNARPPGND